MSVFKSSQIAARSYDVSWSHRWWDWSQKNEAQRPVLTVCWQLMRTTPFLTNPAQLREGSEALSTRVPLYRYAMMSTNGGKLMLPLEGRWDSNRGIVCEVASSVHCRIECRVNAACDYLKLWLESVQMWIWLHTGNKNTRVLVLEWELKPSLQGNFVLLVRGRLKLFPMSHPSC